MNKELRFCGATLLTDSWIVTHGNAVDKTESPGVSDRDIQCGVTNRYSDRQTQQIRPWTTSDVIQHPNRKRYSNNVALIRVSQPFELNQFVNPVRVQTAGVQDNGRLGRVFSWEDRLGPPEKMLKLADLDVLDASACRMQLDVLVPEASKQVQDENICIASDSYPKCRSDAGFPVIREDNGVHTMIGMISWGVKSCAASQKLPIGCARMSAYTQWIEEQIGLVVS